MKLPRFINRIRFDFLTNRGFNYYEGGYADYAIRDYNKAISICDTDATLYCLRGLAYQNKGEHDIAILDFDISLRLNPNLAESHNNKGKSYLAKGKYQKAITCFEKAISINPHDSLFYHNKDRAQNYLLTYNHMKQGFINASINNNESALEEFNAAIALTPNSSYTYIKIEGISMIT